VSRPTSFGAVDLFSYISLALATMFLSSGLSELFPKWRLAQSRWRGDRAGYLVGLAGWEHRRSGRGPRADVGGNPKGDTQPAVHQEFAPYHQVEFYAQIPEARRQLYPYIPPWWSEVQVLPNMMVPLPPVLTFRGSRFLSDYRGTPEGEFYEQVLETEWTASIFER
jgi:hypothetical protein